MYGPLIFGTYEMILLSLWVCPLLFSDEAYEMILFYICLPP
jgi:hypothetical protein